MHSNPHRHPDLVPGTNLMPIPFGMALLAALLCVVTLTIDFAAWQGDIALPPWLSVGDVDDARARADVDPAFVTGSKAGSQHPGRVIEV